MKIEMEMPPAPEGFRYTGEYRRVRDGEWFLAEIGALSPYAYQCKLMPGIETETATPSPILEKIKQPAQLVGFVCWNETCKVSPPMDYDTELLGYGTCISNHEDGRYSIMRYDGCWWNEDGTESHSDEPVYWAHIPNPTRSK